MGVDYIPRKDQEFARWLQQLHKGVQEAQGRLDSRERQQMKALPELAGEFEQVLVANNEAQHQARAAKARKDRIRRQCERSVRVMVRVLQASGKLDNADRAALGIRVPVANRLSRKAAAAPPRTAPVLQVRAQGASHILIVTDEENPTRRAKPPRVRSWDLERVILPIGQRPSSRDGQKWERMGCFGSIPQVIDCPSRHIGERAWYRACWLNPTNRPGPWSKAVSAVIGD